MEEELVLTGSLGAQASEASIAASVQESVEGNFLAETNGIRHKPSLIGRFHEFSHSVTGDSGKSHCGIGLKISAY
jgi:hypothetical protein